MRCHLLYITIATFTLAACSTGSVYNPQDYLAKKELRTLQTKTNFQHCYNYGCKDVADVGLNDDEWQMIAAPFSTVRNAAEERVELAIAIGKFETIVGEKTGTSADKAGTYASFAPNSHDCVDESINTTIYLMLLRQNALLKYHTLHAPSARFPALHGRFAPHQTASITETATKHRYAVDSWFHDNGQAAEIIEFETWKKGWHPPTK